MKRKPEKKSPKPEGREKRGKRDDVLLLRDLTPREDVKGGAGKVPFGQEMSKPGSERGT